MKGDKYLIKALESFNLEWDSDDDCTVENLTAQINDADISISDAESYILEVEENLKMLKEDIEESKRARDLLKSLLHQVAVEEYKDLNKGLDIEIF